MDDRYMNVSVIGFESVFMIFAVYLAMCSASRKK